MSEDEEREAMIRALEIIQGMCAEQDDCGACPFLEIDKNDGCKLESIPATWDIGAIRGRPERSTK